MARRRKRLSKDLVEVTIESLSHDGRGVAHIDGKAIFIDGALPEERVKFQYSSQKRKHDEGFTVEVLEACADRVEPKCKHFGLCGGCSLQHLSAEAQINYKQTAMLDSLKHIGKVEPLTVLPAITAEPWGYRRKARLGAKFVFKKGKALVGFREKRNSFLADIENCEVLHASVGKRLEAMQELVGSMDAKEALPQIEVAVGDNNISLIFRHLVDLTTNDQMKLIAFGKAFDFQIYLQSGGPDTVTLLYPEQAELYYEHPEFDTRVDFTPQDFIQVNTEINRQMVIKAVQLLELTPDDKVLDLFCGLGNFTLPIAKTAKTVVGVEGDLKMVQRAKKIARANGVENTEYHFCNLMGELQNEKWLKTHYDKILIDPPRLGAKEVIEHFAKLKAKRIVYVSCHPATLARDAGELVHTHGYQLLSAGVMDMFPHTAHVESIAVFEKL
ncbi:MAG: 23S rRNA (uracil(1939)-C(5))-methyltransferase RlmD [Thiotrichaceae bacterium]|nr:23S rRNA (uracil(1939)-C(5))-methyltransferase RlmD [Thiotrichaceae bacterium]